MVNKIKYYKPYIPKRLQKFFDRYKTTIDSLFEILQSFKPDIPNSFSYSAKYSPKNRRYRYTDKLFIGCIFYVLKYGTTWESFIGPIPGKQLNKRHNQYLDYDLYSKFYNISLKKYLKTKKIKYLSIDTSTINNKNCTEFSKRNPLNKGRKCGKISATTDDNGSPLSLLVTEFYHHDAKLAIKNLDDLAQNDVVQKAISKIEGNDYILCDKGYDSSNVIRKIKAQNMIPIIPPVNRYVKNKKKKRKLNKRDKKKLKRRIKCEHFFGIIKRVAKINCIYEKKIKSYSGLLLMLCGSILLERINTG